MKKVLSLLFAVLLTCSLCLTVYAVPPSERSVLRWSNISSMYSPMGFNGTSGTANGVVTAKDETANIYGYLTVYKETDAGWAVEGRAFDNVDQDYMGLEVTFTAESGANYMSVFEVYVTIGDYTEHETKTTYATCPQSGSR